MGRDYKRKREDDRDGARSHKRGHHNGSKYNKALTMNGPGIFLTTAKGKERKAALQLLDVLGEHAKRIYPDVKLEPLREERKDPSVTARRRKLTEEDMDALMNGGTLEEPDEPEHQAPAQDEAAEAEGGAENDLQAQLRAELAELGAGSSGASKGRDKSQADAPARFGLVTTGLVDCIAFIRVTPPQDPIKLTYSILEEVEQTGGARCKFVQRLTPIADTCAANYDAIRTLSNHILPQAFTAGIPRTYRIEPRIRMHNVVKREALIQVVGDCVPSVGGHSVNLSEPEVVIVVEIIKNVCGISVVEHWSRFKRFNPAMIAEEVNKKREAGDASGSAGSSNVAGSRVLVHSTEEATGLEEKVVEQEQNFL
ncbi:hypothetical protein OC846_001870 [Tilletia horrida]|uniref:THUMP domain-containing protein n=1 Tax=Tilletia horrida TaxID=155126 RepID=A0AAN6GTC2_9BASI|nr:hypothetical protein OC845_001636 [Tilletia horrida]KAK0555013.1 hypothetical protein OC846_001870 [Tilletia horrida]KAK0568387.1 hypothetical protein OC861_002016 [Tilletia horrida]